MPPLWLDNLIAYSLQLAVVLAVGGTAIRLLGLRMPYWRLLCWQILLLVGLVLPFVQRWDSVSTGVSVESSGVVSSLPPQPLKPATVWVRFPESIAAVLVAGTLLRLGCFALGLLRLRRYRTHSHIEPPRIRMGVRATIATSEEVPGPVTFGFLRPIILLPARWRENEHVLYHELIHVRRGDWLFMAAEELLRAVLWFHPLVWYAIGQIQLAREQVVDLEVVKLTRSREQYLETLLAIAAARSGLDLAPAPLFLRKRHLQKRVASLMKEFTMSRMRLNISLAGLAALTIAGSFVAVRAFPLQAAQQEEQPKRIRVGGNVQSAKLVHKVTPLYPREAKEARIQGTVRLNVIIAKDGAVTDVDLVEGPPELVDSAMTAVRQWVYETTLLNGQPVEVATQVDVTYTLTN